VSKPKGERNPCNRFRLRSRRGTRGRIQKKLRERTARCVLPRSFWTLGVEGPDERMSNERSWIWPAILLWVKVKEHA
jgi:hypothetical protein